MGVRLLLSRVEGLLPLKTASGPINALFLGINDQPYLRKSLHDFPHRTQRLSVARGPVERKIIKQLQNLEHVTNVELGVAFMQVKKEAKNLVRRVNLQPNQGHHQAVLQITSIVAPTTRSTAAGSTITTCRGGAVAMPLIGRSKVLIESPEFGGGKPRQTDARGGLSYKRVQAQHGGSSAANITGTACS
jgi:hypothetical protein